mmetsp:Transcript_88585/g.228427  ORF Transcript_88585/g.228427 Transcript_88585/m.228427 type:complete len:477 (-) Transcript_88585:6-1436(-)
MLDPHNLRLDVLGHGLHLALEVHEVLLELALLVRQRLGLPEHVVVHGLLVLQVVFEDRQRVGTLAVLDGRLQAELRGLCDLLLLLDLRHHALQGLVRLGDLPPQRVQRPLQPAELALLRLQTLDLILHLPLQFRDAGTHRLCVLEQQLRLQLQLLHAELALTQHAAVGADLHRELLILLREGLHLHRDLVRALLLRVEGVGRLLLRLRRALHVGVGEAHGPGLLQRRLLRLQRVVFDCLELIQVRATHNGQPAVDLGLLLFDVLVRLEPQACGPALQLPALLRALFAVLLQEPLPGLLAKRLHAPAAMVQLLQSLRERHAALHHLVRGAADGFHGLGGQQARVGHGGDHGALAHELGPLKLVGVLGRALVHVLGPCHIRTASVAGAAGQQRASARPEVQVGVLAALGGQEDLAEEAAGGRLRDPQRRGMPVSFVRRRTGDEQGGDGELCRRRHRPSDAGRAEGGARAPHPSGSPLA